MGRARLLSIPLLALVWGCGGPGRVRDQNPPPVQEALAAGRIPPVPLLGARPRRPLETSRRRLENGLAVTFLRQPGSPVVTGAIRLSALPARDEPWRPALASLCLVEGGTGALEGPAFREEAAGLGITFRTRAEAGGLVIRFTADPDQLYQALLMLAQLLYAPAYPAEVMVQALARKEELSRGQPPWWALLTGSGPLHGRFPRVEEELPRSEEMRTWHGRSISPSRAVLALAGPLAPAAVDRALDATIAEWPLLAGIPTPTHPGPADPGIYWTEKEEGAPASLTLLLPLGPTWEAGWGARRILAQVLAGEGNRGRLPAALDAAGLQRIRVQRRLVDLAGGESALAVILDDLKDEELPRVLDLLVQVLGGISDEPVTGEEMAAAQRGAWCGESLLLIEPRQVIDRLLSLAGLPGGGEGILDRSLGGVARCSLSSARAAAPAFLPNRALIHIRSGRGLKDSELLARAVDLTETTPDTPSREAIPEKSEPPAAAEVERARALLRLAARALGGMDALSRIEHIRLSGTYSDRAEFPLHEEWLIGSGRLEKRTTIMGLTAHTSIVEGSPPVLLIEGKESPLPAESVARMRNRLKQDPLLLVAGLDIEKADIRILGTRQWRNVPLTQVRVGPPGPRALVLAIDGLSGLVRVVHHTLPEGRVRDVFTDYRDDPPYRHPFRIERWEGRRRLWTFTVEGFSVKSKEP